MSRRSGLRKAIAGLAVVVGGVIASAIWQVADSRRQLRAEVLEESVSNVGLVAEAVRRDLQSHLELVESLAHRRLLAAAAVSGNWGEAEGHLADLLEVSDAFSDAAVLDVEGRVRTVVPAGAAVIGEDVSSRDYVRRALEDGRAYVSDVLAREGSQSAFVVIFASAVRDSSGGNVGVLAAAVPISTFASLVDALDLLGGSVELFDRAGHEIVRPESDPGRSLASHPVVVRALSGERGVGEVGVPGRPGRRLAAWAPVPGVRWGVVFEQPRSAAYRRLGGLTARLTVISVLVVLSAVAAAVVATRLLRRLERERNRAAAILSSIDDGVMTIDGLGRIESVNPAMERLTGWSEADLRGRLHAEALSTFDERGRPVPAEERLIARALESRESSATRGYGVSLLTVEGRRVPVSIAAAPIVAGADLVGAVAVVRDVSHELEVDQLKSALVSTVSHELRTPLTMIRGFAELLVTRDLGEDRSRQALEQIAAAAERLSRLVDDLLSVSRLESGRLVVRTAPVVLSDAVEEALAACPPGHEVHLDVEGVPPILADGDMVVQILTNLVSNAAKYSPSGSPIFIRGRRSGAALEISVEDRGIGLSEDEVAQLFEKFFRVDRREVRQAGGTGLGLYITKNLVELQGGQIWVSSEPGRGTTFTFTLPIARVGEEAELEESFDRRRRGGGEVPRPDDAGGRGPGDPRSG